MCASDPIGVGKSKCTSVGQPTIIVGHLAPDLDCLTAIWILMRFGDMPNAELQFVPSGTTLHSQPVDSVDTIIHVDTGGGRFDHHHRSQRDLCAAELVRRTIAPQNHVLARIVEQVARIDHAVDRSGGFFSVQSLIRGYTILYPTDPHRVAQAMLPNLDAWYATEHRLARLEEAFDQRIEFVTPWGLGIAMESVDGGSSKLAFSRGAVLYAYRDSNGWMGIAAQARSSVDLSPVYTQLQEADPGADWYLHASRRLLLCGTAKSPPRHPSQLTLIELVRVIQGRERSASAFPAHVSAG
jgi:hypothetical protein